MIFLNLKTKAQQLKSERLIELAKLYASQFPEFKKICETDYDSSSDLIDTIKKFIQSTPNSNRSISTLMAYYLTFHSETRDVRNWNNAADAVVLSESNLAWKDFFDKEYETPQDLIKAIPDGSSHSVGTLMSYYITFYPKGANSRNWINAACAVTLYESSSAWKDFFEKEYETPQDLIKAIPGDRTQSFGTLMNYYLSIHSKYGNTRQWVSVANALTLYESSSAWKDFFEKEYETPQDLIKAIPGDRTQSFGTLMNYYLSIHSKYGNTRQWVNVANALVLYESSSPWKDFFDKEYETPQDLIKAIPEGSAQSVATLMTYYSTFYSETAGIRQWIDAANAVVFVLKHPYFLRSKIGSLKNFYEGQRPFISYETFRKYFRWLKRMNLGLPQIRRFSPALRYWDDSLNQKKKIRAIMLLEQGQSVKEVLQDPISIEGKSGLSTKELEEYLVILQRYIKEGIL